MACRADSVRVRRRGAPRLQQASLPLESSATRRLWIAARHLSIANTDCALQNGWSYASSQRTRQATGGFARSNTTLLSAEQKTELYHQGFIILRGVVAPDLINAAKSIHLRDEGAGQSRQVLALLRDSSLNPILGDLAGAPFEISSEHGDWGCYPTIKPAPSCQHLELTAPSCVSRDLHIDGLSAARLPDGSVVNWIDSAETVAVKPFRQFVFVSLNDQVQLGCGQTHVLCAGHIAMTEFFQWQLATCGKVGSFVEGWITEYDSDWPASARDRSNAIPSAVREYFSLSARTSVVKEGGAQAGRLPRPTPLLLRAGDAAIATFALPHAGSPNDRGDERQQMIFRFVPRELELACKSGNPLTFPNWAPRTDGSWYPVGDQCCEAVRQQLVDCWRGWKGMRSVVEGQREATEPLRAALQQHFRQHAAKWRSIGKDSGR